MIDIHCHILYGVDDGPKTRRESVALLKDAKAQGIDKIILTPHYRKGMFDYPLDVIQDHFEFLKLYAKEIGIELFLGCEYHVDSDIICNLQKGNCLPLANSKYVLTEYSHATSLSSIYEYSNEMIAHGYIPIIAHIERYKCFEKNTKQIDHLRQLGCLIQVNASSILGKSKISSKKLCIELLKNSYIDLIASDCHSFQNRPNYMKKCYKYVERVSSSKYAKILFIDNPNSIIASSL